MIILTRDEITAVVGTHDGRVQKPLNERLGKIAPVAK